MTDREVQLNSAVTVAPAAVAAPSDGECVIHNLETAATYRLNDVGARIWELLEVGHSPADIVTALSTEYHLPDGVASDQIACDVLNTIGDLHRYGLLVVAEPDDRPSA
jgi:hypothetical protein